MSTSIIPKAEQYLKHELNVMLVGMHGVGKTEAVLSLAREEGMVLKYYSCSTLDPFTDLVGVPTPRYFDMKLRMYFNTPVHPVDSTRVYGQDPDIIEALKMIRPRDIDEAELLFFDEFNRADDKTQNAVFEIIQFRSINGERLPHVKACWAAMNPPDGDYKVSDLDPALVDRFDVFIDIQPRPSVQYMSGPGGLPKPIAQALYSWWGDHDQKRRGTEHFISPRRLMKIGQVYTATGDFRNAIPRWINCDRTKLDALLQRASADVQKRAAQSNKLGDGPNPQFEYTDEFLKDQRLTVARYLKENQDDFDTHKAVLDAIESKQGRTLARDYAELLSAIRPSMLEGFVSRLNSGKMNSLKEAVEAMPPHRAPSLENLRKELGLN